MESKRQRDIYDFIVRYARRHGYPPTVREIGAEVGLTSPSTVHAHLAKLEKGGYLRRNPTKPRALELVGRARTREASIAQEISVLPLLGQIAAGGPLLAEENVDDYVAVPQPLSRGAGDDFLLRVQGDSMVNAGILQDDYLVVRQQQTVENGEIVAALVGADESANEATVKRFFREVGRIRLQPENDAYEPLYPEHVQILGKVTGVFRQL
ncbi:MAG: transcriptional repressor LexA [Actinomycetia bacterium]|nr:transcriptional repressor LexA [Actinomycetes bacterium]